MAQLQGPRSSAGGRLDGSNATAVTADNFAIGAGWGGTATFAVTEGSTDQVGQIVITASATTPAQATATVALTFIDGAYEGSRFGFVSLCDSTSAVADAQATDVACSSTVLSWTSGVLPVATKVYTYNYAVIAGR